jgi:hypothetical protein
LLSSQSVLREEESHRLQEFWPGRVFAPFRRGGSGPGVISKLWPGQKPYSIPLVALGGDDKARMRRQAKRRNKMDMSRYASSGFIKLENLKGPEQKTIKTIEEGNYDKPDLIFDDRTRLSLNKTNVSTLIRAFGKDDKDWIDKRIEVYPGTLRYNGADNPSVLIRPLTPPTAAKDKPQPVREEVDDEVPF